MIDLPGERMVYQDDFSKKLRGFGPVGIGAIFVILAGNAIVIPLSGLLVLLWTWRSGTSWGDIGYVAPKNWLMVTAVAFASGAAFKLALKAAVMPLLGAPPVNPTYHYLAQNVSALPSALYAVVVGAGFGEETVFRGFMFERFGKLFGSARAARVLVVLITSVWFGAAHYADQGIAGSEQALIVGVVFGSIFAVTKRIWPLVCAHAAFDLTALAIIYWDVESSVAHWIFR